MRFAVSIFWLPRATLRLLNCLGQARDVRS